MAEKTKAMLFEEIQQKNDEIKDLKKDLARLEKYKQYEDSADEIRAIYNSYVNVGFSEDQAFQMLLRMIETAGVMYKK